MTSGSKIIFDLAVLRRKYEDGATVTELAGEHGCSSIRILRVRIRDRTDIRVAEMVFRFPIEKEAVLAFVRPWVPTCDEDDVNLAITISRHLNDPKNPLSTSRILRRRRK